MEKNMDKEVRKAMVENHIAKITKQCEVQFEEIMAAAFENIIWKGSKKDFSKIENNTLMLQIGNEKMKRLVLTAFIVEKEDFFELNVIGAYRFESVGTLIQLGLMTRNQRDLLKNVMSASARSFGKSQQLWGSTRQYILRKRLGANEQVLLDIAKEELDKLSSMGELKRASREGLAETMKPLPVKRRKRKLSSKSTEVI